MPQVELERVATTADSAAARLSRAQATLHEAELAVADTTLRAPFAGTLLSRLVEQGAFVTPRTPGYVLADTSTMKVTFGVPDNVAQNVKMGQLTTVDIPSQNRSLRAPITRIAPAAGPRSRLFELEVSLINEGGALKVGLSATVTLDDTDDPQLGRRVPLRALVNGASVKSEFAVFVVDSAQTPPVARARAVQVTRVIGDDAVLLGLDADARVITLGASLLHDGERVRLAM